MSEYIDEISRANLFAFAKMADENQMEDLICRIRHLIGKCTTDDEFMGSDASYVHSEFNFIVSVEPKSYMTRYECGYDAHIKIDLRGQRYSIEGGDGGLSLETPEAIAIRHLEMLEEGILRTSHLVDHENMPDLKIVEIMRLPGKQIYRPTTPRKRSWNAAMKAARKISAASEAKTNVL